MFCLQQQSAVAGDNHSLAIECDVALDAAKMFIEKERRAPASIWILRCMALSVVDKFNCENKHKVIQVATNTVLVATVICAALVRNVKKAVMKMAAEEVVVFLLPTKKLHLASPLVK